jgi:hypothetical protein
VVKIIHLENTTATNQNYINKVIKGRLNSGNVYYHSNHNISSFHPLAKNRLHRKFQAELIKLISLLQELHVFLMLYLGKI